MLGVALDFLENELSKIIILLPMKRWRCLGNGQSAMTTGNQEIFDQI